MDRVFAFFVLLVTVPLCAASFDCPKAGTPVEKAICSSPRLSAADDKLASAYRAAVAENPETAELVGESQRSWLQFVAQHCRSTDKPTPFEDCLLTAWDDRTEFLQHIAVRRGGVLFFFRSVAIEMPHCGDDNHADVPSCAFYATWPEAVSSTPQWQAWNRALLNEARRFDATQDAEQEIPKDWKLVPDPTWHSDLTVSVELVSVSPALVAAVIKRDYVYAHPAHQERAFNWLLNDGRELEANDVFAPGSAWENWIKDRVASAVRTNDSAQGAEVEEIVAKASRVAVEPRSWRIEQDGVKLIFTEDELGYTTALTMPDVTFTWDELKGYLNPAFEIPQ